MRLGWAERWLRPPAEAMVRLLAASWRYRVRGAEHLHALREAGRPFIFVLWHSQLLPLVYWHRNEGHVMLVSRHRDGAYLADLAVRWGYRSVRGSTRRGGEAGLLGIVRALQGGATVGITPDGPRGPAERVQPGAVAAAQHAGAPLLPISARPSSAWRLRSWDRFLVPRPFARIEIVYGAPIAVAPGKDNLRRGMSDVEHALRELTATP